MSFADRSSLDRVGAALAERLKPAGFKRRGRVFNRPRDGMIDVVDLQLGNGAGRLALADLQPDLSGHYAVNVGIHLPEIWRAESATAIKGVVRDFHCQPRRRLAGGFMPLAQGTDEAVAEHAEAALQFFERWTRASLLDGWVSANDTPAAMTPRARLDVAVMHAARGETAEARRLLLDQLRRRGDVPGHASYVVGLAKTLGIELR